MTDTAAREAEALIERLATPTDDTAYAGATTGEVETLAERLKAALLSEGGDAWMSADDDADSFGIDGAVNLTDVAAALRPQIAVPDADSLAAAYTKATGELPIEAGIIAILAALDVAPAPLSDGKERAPDQGKSGAPG